jgi:hypothetical protein
LARKEAEEAALCYTMHVGAQRAAAEAAESPAAAEARIRKALPMTSEEARAIAAAEGLELVPFSSGETAFKCVSKTYGKLGNIKDATRISANGKLRHLGVFSTPEEAALCYARYIGAERAAAEAAAAELAAAKAAASPPLTADEAWAIAAAEGLELVPSSSNETGFKCVSKNWGKYKVQTSENGKLRHLGNFSTPEEAALEYARHVGAERAAAEAAEARGEGSQPLTADNARAAVAAEAKSEAEAQARLCELEDELDEEEILVLETALGVKRVPSAAAFVAALQACDQQGTLGRSDRRKRQRRPGTPTLAPPGPICVIQVPLR